MFGAILILSLLLLYVDFFCVFYSVISRHSSRQSPLPEKEYSVTILLFWVRVDLVLYIKDAYQMGER